MLEGLSEVGLMSIGDAVLPHVGVGLQHTKLINLTIVLSSPRSKKPWSRW